MAVNLEALKAALLAAQQFLIRWRVYLQVPMPEQTDKGNQLYAMAKSLLGQHVIPLTAATDYGVLGCAASVNAIYKKTFGEEIGGGASTALMLAFLMDTRRFESVLFQDALPGDIAISATGKSIYYPAAHGHVAICGKQWLMSNDSENGTWEANYTYNTWNQHFAIQMGFPVQVFRPI